MIKPDVERKVFIIKCIYSRLNVSANIERNERQSKIPRSHNNVCEVTIITSVNGL